MKIICRTTLDITATGITGHYKPSRVPFLDNAGQNIVNQFTWTHSRNQQRNWETLTQLISLRTQVNWTLPIKQNNQWEFEFETDNDTVWTQDNDALCLLRQDCEGVPMVGPEAGQIVSLCASGPEQNVWFETINI